MNNLIDIYTKLCVTSSDINEHLPTLEKYTTECDHVTEMGVRWVVSTYAFMMGKPKRLISYDIIPVENHGINRESLKEIARVNGVDFDFIVGDTREIEIEETDLLFIDTWHVYEQLKTELSLHSSKVKKYIILHDTTTFETIGENDKLGIWVAVEEFLSENNDWVIHERFQNNNGLTILKRQN